MYKAWDRICWVSYTIEQNFISYRGYKYFVGILNV